MPFPIWCTSCPKETIIGQGVRFNAEKKKVGSYYSTPIYSFRMKHTACGGWIEIRTDPKNTAYVVTEGAKKRDTGDDKTQEGVIEIRTEEEKERLRNDAFAALEVTIDDKKQASADKARINELGQTKDKDWEDPYAASQKVRRKFRVERKVREKNQALTESLKDRMSLGMDLLDENEEDRRRAAHVEFGDFGETSTDSAIKRAQTRTLFAMERSTNYSSSPQVRNVKLKSERKAELSKEKLHQELNQNTRASLDPFLSSKPILAAPSLIGIKRKRYVPEEKPSNGSSTKFDDTPSGLLVDYDSD